MIFEATTPVDQAAAAHDPITSSGLHTGELLLHDALGWVVFAINGLTIAVLAWGVVYGVVRFCVVEGGRIRGKCSAEDQRALRRQVGFYLLFALELLIAADVIETMIRPTLEQLAILAGVSAIRIATGYALGREVREIKAEDSDG